MARQNHDTECHTVKLWPGRGGGFADLFIEREVPEGAIGFEESCIFSVVPRGNPPRLDLKMTVDQLERVAAWLTEYARRMRASGCGAPSE